MTLEVLGPVLGALGIGVALAGAPGPVQAILLTESVRRLPRGIRALLGAASTWLTLLLLVALGVSIVAPEGAVFVKGALWRGRTNGEPIEAGTTIRVRSVEGLILHVEAEPPLPAEQAGA